MIPYCWLKQKPHTDQVFQNQPLFSRMWKLKYAQVITCTIRTKELPLMKEFGNFKYDREE